MSVKILRGNIAHAPVFGELETVENGYLAAKDGRVEGVYKTLPARFQYAAVQDMDGRLITPAFCDMHLHAPQYPMLGIGMDLQLLEWLESCAFKTEAMFEDEGFARNAYRSLAAALIENGTTRVCAFSSVHTQATLILMEELDRAGISGYVGKVNMDSNCPDSLRETAEESLLETRRWLDECAKRKGNIKPIITPRFTPSCSRELMRGLGRLAREYGVRVQSHLSENLDEIEWVKELMPDCKQYWETYDSCGLFEEGTIMAHCVYSDERERAAMREHSVLAVHCPDSNVNITTGIAPVRRMLNEGLSVALGSDIAGGSRLSMAHTAVAAIRASKHNWLQSGRTEAFLTVAEAFYLATSAGQAYFLEGAGFKQGDPLHALVLDDSFMPPSRPLSVAERLERLMYNMEPRAIAAVISDGIVRKGAFELW